MFCDLVGSTTLASTLEPEDLRDVLLVFREACANAIQQLGGTVGQYLGDGILAYFGYPKAREDDAQRALRAALQARNAMAGATSELHRRGIPLTGPITIRIGLHSGLVVVADLGKGRNAETAAIVGETTNIAARLQAAALPGRILASEATARLSGSKFELISAGTRQLSGIALPIQTFEVGDGRIGIGLSAFTGELSGFTPFLARKVELDALRTGWAAVLSGERVLIAVEAEAGMGKSRLVCEFSSELNAKKYPTIVLSCSQDDRSTPYHPILSWMRSELDISDWAEPETIRNALQKTLPEPTRSQNELYLASVLDCLRPGEQSEIPQAPRRRRRETMDALVQFMESRLAPRGPHLLVVEDLHWSDESTVSLIKALSDYRSASWRMLIVLTSRKRLAFHPMSNSVTLILKRLPEVEARYLVRALVATGTTDEFIESIVKRTDGIPLFAVEVARLTSTRTNSSFSYEKACRDAIPLTLRGALLEQLDTLGSAKSIAQVAAVIGRSFQADVLTAVMGDNDDSAINVALAKLVDLGFFEVQTSTSEVKTYVFRHALLRDAAYDSILNERRRILHATIGKVLTEIYPVLSHLRPEVLASHFALAGLPRDAADHYESAARRAASRSTHADAMEHCHLAIAQVASIPMPERAEREIRLQILLAAQITATRGNAAPAVLDAFEKAREMAEAIKDRDWLHRAHRGLLTYHLVKGNICAGYAISDRLMELAANDVEEGGRIQLHRPRGLALLYMARFEEARQELLIVVSLYNPEVHADQRFDYGSDPLVLARSHLGWVEWFIGNVARGIKECESAVSIARALKHPHSLAFALAFQACLYEFADMAEAAGSTATELIQISEHNEYAYWSAWGRIILGWSKGILEARREDGEELLRRGLAEYEATGAELLLPYGNILLSDLVAGRDGRLAKRLRELALEQAAAGAMNLWQVLLTRRKNRFQWNNDRSKPNKRTRRRPGAGRREGA